MKQPIAVFGLGRSGLSTAAAAKSAGWDVAIYDQSREDQLAKPEMLYEAKKLNIPISMGWNGRFEVKPAVMVINPAIPSDNPAILSAVTEGVEVISEIEFAFQVSKAPILAITGTNGKSTTTVMTYLALRASGVDAILCGNIFGSGYPEMSMTDAAAASTPSQVLVAEVSSFQLEWIREFHPRVAGITNVWPDHLDRYSSFEDYAAAKHRIFENQNESDFAVVRANDPVVTPPGQARSGYVQRGRRRLSSSARVPRGPKLLTFGATGREARVEERDLVLLDLKAPLEELPFTEPHNYQNACMASLLAYAALVVTGKTEEGRMPLGVVEGLMSFKGLAHRMELVGSREGVRVFNNSMCTNPDAVIKSVQAVKDRTHILMGGTNKKLDFGPLRHYLANHRHQAYLFGKDADQLASMLGGNIKHFATMQDAFHEAAKSATKNEVIMLAPGCASTDAFRDFRERGDVFRALATDWLKK